MKLTLPNRYTYWSLVVAIVGLLFTVIFLIFPKKEENGTLKIPDAHMILAHQICLKHLSDHEEGVPVNFNIKIAIKREPYINIINHYSTPGQFIPSIDQYLSSSDLKGKFGDDKLIKSEDSYTELSIKFSNLKNLSGKAMNNKVALKNKVMDSYNLFITAYKDYCSYLDV